MKKLAVILALALAAAPAFAGTGALKLSLWDKIAVAVPNNTHEVTGLDFGIGSTTDVVKGVQLDILFAQTTYEMKGVSLSWIINMANEMTGVQGALFAKAENMTGVQFGLVNFANKSATGVQWGFYNQAEYMHGLQLGFVNYARTIDGLQIGLLNIAENGWFPAMILVNGRF